ncbi:hypothetical protein PG994_002798 [Apiospora phragmitis]|uniref:Uncharacterized protein n=1 Tax=Apiospora phragmitis TaxID=2905665 RepID=A0ABR1W661_9PEZI
MTVGVTTISIARTTRSKVRTRLPAISAGRATNAKGGALARLSILPAASIDGDIPRGARAGAKPGLASGRAVLGRAPAVPARGTAVTERRSLAGLAVGAAHAVHGHVGGRRAVPRRRRLAPRSTVGLRVATESAGGTAPAEDGAFARLAVRTAGPVRGRVTRGGRAAAPGRSAVAERGLAASGAVVRGGAAPAARGTTVAKGRA